MSSPSAKPAGDASPLRVHVAGWRGVPHSIALVNQWQMLSMLKMPGIRLTCEDLTYASPSWTPRSDIFNEEQTAQIESVPPLQPGEGADVDLLMPFRVGDYRPSGRPTVAFLPAELRGPAVLDAYESAASLNGRTNMLYLAASHWVRDSFVGQGVDPKRVIVLGHGVDTGIYRRDTQLRELARTQLRLDRFTFLHVSGMFGLKGVTTLLASFLSIVRRGVAARLLLKGTDGVYSSRAHLIDSLKLFSPEDRATLTANITYVGRPMSMQDMAALYNAADCYVISYHAEGFCMPVLEAVACGLPVICTGGGATDDFTTDDFRRSIKSDLSDDGHTVVLTPDADDLARLMADMANDAGFRAQAAVAGPAYVAAHATWDRITARLVDVLRGWANGRIVSPQMM